MTPEAIALTGAGGMLGRSLRLQPGVDWKAMPPSRVLDLRDREAVLAWFAAHRPQKVIHAAAMTAVDFCEEHPKQAHEVNGDGTRHVVEGAQSVGARLIYVSTDYVFDGSGESPWRPDQPTSPINCYGESKLAGEEAVRAGVHDFAIARVSWLYGPGGPSFLHTMAKLGKARQGSSEPLRVVSDQVGAPTSTLVLAKALCALADSSACGTFHIAPSGAVSWFEYAKYIFGALNFRNVPVEPCTSDEFKRPAARPRNSRLDTVAFNALKLYDLGTWQEGVEAFATSYREELV